MLLDYHTRAARGHVGAGGASVEAKIVGHVRTSHGHVEDRMTISNQATVSGVVDGDEPPRPREDPPVDEGGRSAGPPSAKVVVRGLGESASSRSTESASSRSTESASLRSTESASLRSTESASSRSTESASLRSTESITEALAAGDHRRAIALCVRQHAAAVGRVCFLLLGSRAEADESLQETFLTAYDGAAAFRGDAPIRAWLLGIARRICARRLEVRTRQARRARLLREDEANDDEAPDALVEDLRRSARVRAALDDLRPTEREALLLRFEGELTYAEIGDALGIDEATARKRVSRGLSRIRSQLAT
jgi:RNA polymerase sigma-70 factor (ECF subfamily)